MYLVVGATGHVGGAVVRQLSERGASVRAFVRRDGNVEHLRGLPGVELAYGDLREPASVRDAVRGCRYVIATANGVAPRRRSDVGIERAAYPGLIAAATAAGVERFVYLSTIPLPDDERVPMQRDKRFVEGVLMRSGIEFAVLRPTAFMESWLAMPGSSIPLRGDPTNTLRRPFWFLRGFRAVTRRMVEDRGRMVVNGGAEARICLISVEDVARMLVAACTHDRARNAVLEVGGPEVLTGRDVADVYAQLLGRPVTVTAAPVGVFRVLARVLAPFSPAAANLMALNVATATGEAIASPDVAEELGVGPLERVETFLKGKVALPDEG